MGAYDNGDKFAMLIIGVLVVVALFFTAIGVLAYKEHRNGVPLATSYTVHVLHGLDWDAIIKLPDGSCKSIHVSQLHQQIDKQGFVLVIDDSGNEYLVNIRNIVLVHNNNKENQ